jgi:hypothetical protein
MTMRCLRWMLLAGWFATLGCKHSTPLEPVVADASDDKAAIAKLFDDAETCGDRYQCPALSTLQQRAERPGEFAVMQVAFDIMSDPKVQTFERLFKMASTVARAWAAARTTMGHKLSPDEERELHTQVTRLLARTDTSIPAHGFVEYLSDAREIFEREALDPRRGNDEVHSAIRGLSNREPDLSTVKTWLSSTQERPMIAGALLLDAMDHATIHPTEEVAMLLDFARRTDTTAESAQLIARHAVDHDDPAFLPVLRALSKHPDATVRALAATHSPR